MWSPLSPNMRIGENQGLIQLRIICNLHSSPVLLAAPTFYLSLSIHDVNYSSSSSKLVPSPPLLLSPCNLMEALAILKFWRNAADVTSDETDDDDSFFDFNFRSPHRGAVKEADGDLKKDVKFFESPRDVLRTKNDHFSHSKPLSPATILRSAPKFKVFMLGFRKSSKCDKAEPTAELKATPLNQLSKSSKLNQSNRFSVKCKAADGPVLARDNSLRSKMMKENIDFEAASDVSSAEKSVPKYLKLIKPFYVKVSNKSKSTDSLTPSSSPVTAPVNWSPRKFSEGSRVGSFKMVTRSLGKSRSASAAVGAAPLISRRDDSLLEQSDGIQGAILHCKKSFNSSAGEYSQLSHEKLRSSFEEQKRCSI